MSLPVFNLYEPHGNPTEIYFRENTDAIRRPHEVDTLQLPSSFKVTPANETEKWSEHHPTLSGDSYVSMRSEFEPTGDHPDRQNSEQWGVESDWWDPRNGIKWTPAYEFPNEFWQLSYSFAYWWPLGQFIYAKVGVIGLHDWCLVTTPIIDYETLNTYCFFYRPDGAHEAGVKSVNMAQRRTRFRLTNMASVSGYPWYEFEGASADYDYNLDQQLFPDYVPSLVDVEPYFP